MINNKYNQIKTKMKKLINILPLFIIGMLVSLSMTSCVDNDDDTNGLTENEIKTCIMTMSGSFRENSIISTRTSTRRNTLNRLTL